MMPIPDAVLPPDPDHEDPINELARQVIHLANQALRHEITYAEWLEELQKIGVFSDENEHGGI